MAKPTCVVIADLPSPGHLGGVFSELIVALTHTLHTLGVTVDYTRQLPRTRHPVIVFGLYRAFLKTPPTQKLPGNYFIFNLAPLALGKLEWFDHYIRYIAQHPCIDYAPHNADLLETVRGPGHRAHLFKFGYFNLLPFSGFDRGSAYVFFGALNEARKNRLDELRAAGVPLTVLQNTWGLERDIQLRRARAVINIGKYEPNLLEVYRLWHTLCLGTPVYSDAGADARLAASHAPYVRIFERLDASSLQETAISPEVYRRETDFTASTQSLLDFISDHGH